MSQAKSGRPSGGPKNDADERSGPIWSKKVWTGSGVLEIAVWSRTIGSQGGERDVLNTTLKKTYKDGEKYKESSSFRPEELGLIAFALQEAFSFIVSEQNRE